MVFEKKIGVVFIIVHPHFETSYVHPNKILGRKFSPRKKRLPPQLREMAQRNLAAELNLAKHEALHRAYKSQIDYIARNKRAFLIILKGTIEEIRDDSRIHAISFLKRQGIRREVAEKVYEHLSQNQRRLLKYARKRIPELRISEARPENIGKTLEQMLYRNRLPFSKEVPIRIIGEYRRACVREAFYSLVKHGFNPKIIESKTVDWN